ncbi:MAG: ABC transporter permease [Calditrichales bacterium]|nr:MAG: ABC transporter permease [Calditrichales bacterium]
MRNFFNQRQLTQLVLAHFREIIREPGVIFWGIVFPILMALGLGIAFTKKADVVHHVAIIEVNDKTVSSDVYPSAIQDFLRNYGTRVGAGTDSAEIYQLLLTDEKLGDTKFLFRKTSWPEAIILLKRGNLSIVLENKKGQVAYHFDPLNPEGQLTFLKLSRIINSGISNLTTIKADIEPLTVSGTRYIDFLIPGLIAMGVMMSSLWGISYNIIEKRSKKLLRRMIATPMRRSYFLLALISVRITLNFIESVLLFIFAWLVFDITIQGNIAALIGIFIAGNISFAGIAIFVSSHTANTEIGNGLINVVVMPMMVLSGIFFSYHNFPEWAIPYIKKFPLTMLADGIRSIFIEGAGYAEVALPFFILMTIGIVFFAVGLKIFKWY